ncbi:MAG TPA: hypothetical protein VFE55_09620 [Acidimicrobiia bacterium]|nr:hypothetical protein [Acidimicrobiia bacterium]
MPDWVFQLAMVVHIYSAIVLVGSMFFNAFILGPALRRIPPAQAATVGDKIGAGLRVAGPVSLVLLVVTGMMRLHYMHLLGKLFTWSFLSTKYGSRIGLMFTSWFVLAVTGTLSLAWYEKVLARKLPFTAGLRDLEERRAAQQKVSEWQERMNYVNVTIGILAVLGGSFARVGL